MHAFIEFGRKFEEQETWRREGTGFDWKTETLRFWILPITGVYGVSDEPNSTKWIGYFLNVNLIQLNLMLDNRFYILYPDWTKSNYIYYFNDNNINK